MKTINTIIFTLLFSTAALYAQVNTEGQKVLEKLYSVYGGKEKIAAFKSMQQSGTTFSTTRNNSADLTRTYRFPYHLNITKKSPEAPIERRIIADEKGWRNGKEVEGMLKDSMLLQAARMMVPKLLLENSHKLRYNGLLKSEDGKTWHIFRVSLPGGGSLMVQVEPESYYIRATVAMMSLDKWRTMQFITTYDEFKNFDGYLFGTKEQHYAMNKYVGWSEIRSIDFKTGFDSKTFLP